MGDDVEVPTTPYAGTPPNGAPEDAYRNLHRDDSPQNSTQQHASQEPVYQDEISMQIENY